MKIEQKFHFLCGFIGGYLTVKLFYLIQYLLTKSASAE
jgi:hypothetical protein